MTKLNSFSEQEIYHVMCSAPRLSNSNDTVYFEVVIRK